MKNGGKRGFTIYCIRFGQIAVELGFITKEQLKEVLSEQVEDEIAHKPHRLIGGICFNKGWMTPKQIEIIFNKLFKDEIRRQGMTCGLF